MLHRQNKNPNCLNSLIFERKLIFFSTSRISGAQESAEAADPKAQQLLALFSQKMPSISTRTLDDLQNPYSNVVASGLANLPDAYLNASTVKHENRRLIVSAPGVADLEITDEFYYGLLWTSNVQVMKNYDPQLAAFPNELFALGLAHEDDAAAFMTLWQRVSDHETPSPTEIQDAIAQLDALRPYLATEASSQRVQLRSSAERQTVMYPSYASINPDETAFLANYESTYLVPRNYMRIDQFSTQQEAGQFNPETWDFASKKGLERIFKECELIGVPVHEPYFQDAFARLAHGIDQTQNRPNLSNPAVSPWFYNPAAHYSNLEGLVGYPGKAFVAAHKTISAIKEQAITNESSKLNTLINQEDENDIPLVDDIGEFFDGVTDRVGEAWEQAQNGSYGSLIAMGVLAFIAAKGAGALYSKLGESKYKEIAWIITGGLAGLLLLAPEAAKRLLKGKDYPVKGTSMEAVLRIVRANKDDKEAENLQDVDPGVLRSMGNANLGVLMEEMMESQSKGIDFIDPRVFSECFPKINGIPMFDMYIGEGGLDYKNAVGQNLNADQRKFIETGQKIYKVALALVFCYNNKLREQPKYGNEPLPDVVKHGYGEFMTVRNFCDALLPHTVDSDEGIEATFGLTDDLHEVLVAGFTPSMGGFDIEEVSDEPGHYPGKINGFPVMFVYDADADAYRVYLKNQYNGPGDFDGEPIALIPKDKDDPNLEARCQDAVDGVGERMEVLMAPLRTGGWTYSAPSFMNSRWESTVNIPSGPGATSVPQTAVITPYADGYGVLITVPGTPIRISLDHLAASQNPLHLQYGPSMISQFPPLGFFEGARLMIIEDPDPTDNFYTVKLGKRQRELVMELRGNTWSIPNTGPYANQETNLMSDGTFVSEILEILREDEHFEFNKTVARLEDTIRAIGIDEDFFGHFWDSMVGHAGPSALAGFNLDAIGSGPIPDNFIKLIMGGTIEEAYARAGDCMLGGTLSGMQACFNQAFASAEAELNSVNNSLNQKHADLMSNGEDWERDDVLPYIDRIRGASCKSDFNEDRRIEFEKKLYNLDFGLFTHSDIADNNAMGMMMAVRAKYLSPLDEEIYSYEHPPGTSNTLTIMLDESVSGGSAPRGVQPLTYPPTRKYPGVATLKDWQDPGLRGHYIRNYFEYVENNLIVGASSRDSFGSSISDLPGPNSQFWSDRIMPFEEWAEQMGTSNPLDQLSAEPIEHNNISAEHTAGRHTDLEQHIIDEINDDMDALHRDFPTLDRAGAVKDFLEGGGSYHGFFKIHSSGGTNQCDLWDRTSSIPTSYTSGTPPVHHGLSRRQQQIYIDGIRDHIIEEILREPDDFFTVSSDKLDATVEKFKRAWRAF